MESAPVIQMMQASQTSRMTQQEMAARGWSGPPAALVALVVPVLALAPLAWHRVVSRQEAVCAAPAETEMAEAQSQVEAGWPGFSALAHSPHVAQRVAPTA